jgi:hypothetical protein
VPLLVTWERDHQVEALAQDSDKAVQLTIHGKRPEVAAADSSSDPRGRKRSGEIGDPVAKSTVDAE